MIGALVKVFNITLNLIQNINIILLFSKEVKEFFFELCKNFGDEISCCVIFNVGVHCISFYRMSKLSEFEYKSHRQIENPVLA